MGTLLNKLLYSKFETRTAAIWGCGNNSKFAIDILKKNNVKTWVWIDKNKKAIDTAILGGKPLFSPDEIVSDYYILVSSSHIDEIKEALEKRGLKELDDWIYALEEEYYEALIKHQDAKFMPDILISDLDNILFGLKQIVDTQQITIDSVGFSDYEKRLDFSTVYNKKFNKRYRRKIKEYYLVDELLDFSSWNEEDIYLDIGAAGSPYVSYLRSKGVNAYAIDLEESPISKDYYICGDATKTDFEDNSVKGISLQSAFEMFPYDTDIQLIKEIGRILKPNCKAVILPLYLHKEYISSTSPNYYGKGFADKGSNEYIRTDCWSAVPIGRFYDVSAFNQRVVDVADVNGLDVKVYYLANKDIEKDKFVYLKFILELTKNEN